MSNFEKELHRTKARDERELDPQAATFDKSDNSMGSSPLEKSMTVNENLSP